MTSGAPSARLLGRRAERRILDQLLTDVRAGRSQVLVMTGEAGIGKTALLDHLSERATGLQILRCGGVESEMELAFAGLHQLCSSMTEQISQLPAPQRDALAVAFGISAGPPPDRFLVGLAVLSLLAEAADRQPLVCLVDDAQWLDQASSLTLAFVARRLLAEPIALVFASRPTEEQTLRGLPQLAIDGLDYANSRAVVSSTLPGPLDAAVLEQIVAECNGNPLALIELPHLWSSAGGIATPAEAPLWHRMEVAFLRRLQPLPEQTRKLLLTAAAEPSGDPELLWRAAARLGIRLDAAMPAEAAGLIELGVRIRFRHPLVRSTAYRSASVAQRERVHRALAETADPVLDPDRRAWHRAQSTSEPDESIAADLESSAGRAESRGGLAAAAAFLERAVTFSVDRHRRVARILAAARFKLQAGAADDAIRLLAMAQSEPLDEVQEATVCLLRGQLAFVSPHGRDAPPLLLAAARRMEHLDPVIARDTYLEAFAAALFVGRMAGETRLSDIATAALSSTSTNAEPPDLLLRGLTAVVAEGYLAGAPRLKLAVASFRSEELAVPDALRWLFLATHAAHDLWDDDSWKVLCERHINLARGAGALGVLPIALSARIGLHLFSGELAPAASLVDELRAIADATGSQLPAYGAIALAAWRGREAEAVPMMQAALEETARRGEGMGLTLVQHAQAVLYNGLGRYEEALVPAAQAARHPEELAFATWSLVQFIEAAVRCGQTDAATDALQQLLRTTTPSGTNWALGIAARSRALLSDGDDADSQYREAIDHLGRTPLRMELSRAQLLYGEWLGRRNRRRDARENLRAAYTAFSTMGAEAFAERARQELLAVGGQLHPHPVESDDHLTAQEAQIARLAVAGRTNPEIGAELFLSPRTVEWHLRKVFTKLGITSRRQLHTALPELSPSGLSSAN